MKKILNVYVGLIFIMIIAGIGYLLTITYSFLEFNREAVAFIIFTIIFITILLRIFSDFIKTGKPHFILGMILIGMLLLAIGGNSISPAFVWGMELFLFLGFGLSVYQMYKINKDIK